MNYLAYKWNVGVTMMFYSPRMELKAFTMVLGRNIGYYKLNVAFMVDGSRKTHTKHGCIFFTLARVHRFIL